MPSACESHGCSGGPEPLLPPPPSFGDVIVNGVEIDPEAIAQEIQHHPAPDAETAWIEAARALAVRELLLQEARRLGLEPDPETDEAGRAEAEDDALVRMLLEEEVQPANAGETECRRYYDANVERFRTPDLFDAAHILIEPEGEDEAAWASAEARARDIAAKVGDNDTAFAAAARAFSGCASAQQDGSLGQIRRGELVASVQAGIEALADGETGHEPVRSRFGWHVLRLQRRIEGQILPFEAVRERIADMLEARSWSVEAARYIADLARRGQVEGVLIEGAAA
ncbi:peptidylprolyl isomerase [Sphingosinicella sp. YJ22]|uniref:peptidylprolyl isomerase n=1 Tax=Sphingosinicella sp. YJ22 TaxID=1104780 RepID=UPI00140D454D|nr:peptidylprolyl isomerase [Sphingosinicella sp. YJ22]